MGVTLALVTCGPQLEVALAGNAMPTVSVVRLGGGSPRSTLVLAAVDLLFEDAGIPPTETEAILVTRGPGSFTGIRAGLATATGLAAAVGCRLAAFDSLLVQAARVERTGLVWAAQPGRRGELYACRYSVAPGRVPEADGSIVVVPVGSCADDVPWIAAEAVDIGERARAGPARTAAEALLRVADAGAPPQPLEPLYVEPPPIQGIPVGRSS